MKKARTLAITGAILAASAVTGHAGTLSFLKDMTLDLSTIGINQEIAGIDSIGYSAINHVNISDNNGDGFINSGDTFVVDGLVTATSLKNNNVGILGTGLTNTWELTMKFSAQGTFNDLVDQDGIHFDHTGTGYLDLYLQNGPNADSNGNGYTDVGTNAYRVAHLVQNNQTDQDGGALKLSTQGGTDKALFSIMNFTTDLAPGVFFASDGKDLQTSQGFAAIFTSSTFDYPALINPTNWENEFGAGSNTTSINPTTGQPFQFWAAEDGNAQVVTPEPSTIALMGLGLAGIGFYSRRKKK